MAAAAKERKNAPATSSLAALMGSGDLPVESFQLTGQALIARPARLLRALGLDPPPTIRMPSSE